MKYSWTEQVCGSSTIRSDSSVEPLRPLLMMMALSICGSPPGRSSNVGLEPGQDLGPDLVGSVDQQGVPEALDHDVPGPGQQPFGFGGEFPYGRIRAVQAEHRAVDGRDGRRIAQHAVR